jgi:uncharacterized membrane protein (DUF485 family)
MDTSRLTSKFNTVKDRNSLLTIALFAFVLAYTLAVLPAAFLTAQHTSLTVTDTATILSPIGTILVSLLLAALYYRMLTVQDTQVDIMDRQAKWAEAANTPAIIIDQWWVEDRDTVVFSLHNKGNSHVEEMRLLVDLEITDTMTGETVTEFESRSTLSKEDVEGFESRFLPANTTKPTTFTTGIGFERETSGGSARFSNSWSVLHDLTEDREKVLPCEFTMTLETIAPGENVEQHEFYRFSVSVFEEADFVDLIEEVKWEGRTLHVNPD